MANVGHCMYWLWSAAPITPMVVLVGEAFGFGFGLGLDLTTKSRK